MPSGGIEPGLRRRPCRVGFICGLAIALCGSVGGCDRLEPASGGAPVSADASLDTLRGTFDALRDAYARAAYLRLWPMIEKGSREEVVGVLLALDELLAANAAALDAIESSCAECDPAAFDWGARLENNLGVFSKEVEYVGEQVGGERGAITIQVAGRLPLEQVTFARREGRWVYVPDASSSGLIPVLRDAAHGLDRIALVLRKRSVTPSEVVEEYAIRVSPKLDRIAELSAATE